MTAAEILRGLVAIATPSSVSNIPLLEFAREILEGRNWRVELLRYSDEAGIEKANLLARPHSANWNGQIGLAFVCHTDTVPFSPEWKSALALTQVDDQLHGCGSCDVKGSLGCFLAALQSLEPQQVRPDVALLLTADEEVGCKGMERLLASTNLRIDAAIVSEPTSLRPGIAGKGYGLARITVRGIEAHSAYPEEGISAIAIAAHMIARIYQIEAHNSRVRNPLFVPPHTTLNIGTIQGGSAKNIIPGSCSFLIEWRPIPAQTPGAMLAEIQELACQFQQANPRARISVEALRGDAGFSPGVEGPLRHRLLEVMSAAGQELRSPVGISFGSEASRLARVADEVIVIGPGDMHTAHSERECVPLAELEEWTATLRTLLTEHGLS